MVNQRVRLPDGRELGAVVSGSGAPTVVFESGLGGSAASWVAVQREVASTLRTVSYDRAGIGPSTPDSAPRDLRRLASDLDQLLAALGEEQPVILVGHSWGAAVLRAFADLHPARVAGLVLVDPTLSAVVTPRQARQNRWLTAVLAAIAPTGLHRPLVRAAIAGAPGRLAEADRAALLETSLAAGTMRATAREAAQLAASLPFLEELEQRGLPPVPVTTIVGGELGKGAGADLRRTLLQAARSEMAAHPHGTVVVAERSGHAVPLQEPDVIVRVILAMAAITTSADSQA